MLTSRLLCFALCHFTSLFNRTGTDVKGMFQNVNKHVRSVHQVLVIKYANLWSLQCRRLLRCRVSSQLFYKTSLSWKGTD